jgi:hypothetical protein
LEYLEGFADNMFIPRVGSNLKNLKCDLEHSLENISKWCSQSGLVVNCVKTEICLFYKRDIGLVGISIGNDIIITINQMNVLGTIFDSMLQWNAQVCKCIKKAN